MGIRGKGVKGLEGEEVGFCCIIYFIASLLPQWHKIKKALYIFLHKIINKIGICYQKIPFFKLSKSTIVLIMYIIWTIMQTPMHVGGGTFWNIYAGILHILPVATTKIQQFYFLYFSLILSSHTYSLSHSILVMLFYK